MERPRIHFHVRSKLSTGEVMVSEERDLRLGAYNEFYLPSLDSQKEVWIEVVDSSGVETTLHLKR